MATLSKARELLSDLRSASYKAAIKDHEELQAFVKEQVVPQFRCLHSSLYTDSMAVKNACLLMSYTVRHACRLFHEK